MANTKGVRFRARGIAEQALKSLAARPRRQYHHFDLALQDLKDAHARLPKRQATLDAAKQARALAIGGHEIHIAERALAQAKLNLDNAKRAINICQSRLKSKVDPKTGRPISHASGRAPHHLEGPQGLLDREKAARDRLDTIEAVLATGNMLPELTSPHERWQRLQFAHYVDSIAHEDARHAALPNVARRGLADHLLAVVLYVEREASKNGVPLVVGVAESMVRIEHALWAGRLNQADFELVANFVIFSAKRIQLTVHWSGSEPTLFEIGAPSPRVDYAHILRRLRERNWRSPAAQDADLFEDMPTPDPAQPPTEAFKAWLATERHERQIEADSLARYRETGIPQLVNGKAAEPTEWINPIPRLDSCGLPYSLVRLFRGMNTFYRVPPARLSARVPGQAWYTVTGSYVVSPDLIAGELAVAIANGDLDCVLWWKDQVFPSVADDVVTKAIQITERILRAGKS